MFGRFKSKSEWRRITEQEGHTSDCEQRLGWFMTCDCPVRHRDSYFDYEEPPERRSKSAKPKMGMSGRSLKTVIDRVMQRGKRRR